MFHLKALHGPFEGLPITRRQRLADELKPDIGVITQDTCECAKQIRCAFVGAQMADVQETRLIAGEIGFRFIFETIRQNMNVLNSYAFRINPIVTCHHDRRIRPTQDSRNSAVKNTGGFQLFRDTSSVKLNCQSFACESSKRKQTNIANNGNHVRTAGRVKKKIDISGQSNTKQTPETAYKLNDFTKASATYGAQIA